MEKHQVTTVSLEWIDRGSVRHISRSEEIRTVIARFASAASRDDARIVFHLQDGGMMVLEMDSNGYFVSAKSPRPVQS